MNDSTLIQDLTSLIEKQGQKPLAIHEAGGIVYIISGLITIGNESGYPILRTTSATSTHTYLDTAFLLESTRVSGSNGSAANVNLKTDAANSLLLLADPALIYG